MKSGIDPTFQILLIASALLHILAIALISHPFMNHERIDDSYYVKLVTPSKSVQKPVQKSKSRKVKKTKPTVTVKPAHKPEPVKKVQKKKSAVSSIKPIKRKSIKKRLQADKKYTKSARSLDESKNVVIKNVSIKRKAPQLKKEPDRSFSTNRTDRGSTFLEKADTRKNMGIITGKEVAKKTEHEHMEKGMREQSFHLSRNYPKDQEGITRSSGKVEGSDIQLEKAYRDSIYEEQEREAVDESQYAIARSQKPVVNEKVYDLSKEESIAYPDNDFTGESDVAELTGDEGVQAIQRPVELVKSKRREISQDIRKEQFIKNTEIAEEKKNNDKKNMSELRIKGVPLDELNACTNALDERMLKKKILNVIGENRGCYRNGVGEFLFMGTSRFASFDMKILPLGGRKLSNRCEELKNAFYCLTSERNN